MSASQDCSGCDGKGYEFSDEGTYEPDVRVYPCSICDGSGIEPPAVVTIAAQAAFEKNETTLRSDFARVTDMRRRNFESFGRSDDEWTEHIQAAWLASDHAADWQYLNTAYIEWREFPDTMQGLFQHMHKARSDTGVCPLTEVQWRSQEQARDLTGHGRQLEQQRPVNAFAAAAVGTEREGSER